MKIRVQRANSQHLIDDSEFAHYQAKGYHQIDDNGNIIVKSFAGRTSYTLAEFEEMEKQHKDKISALETKIAEYETKIAEYETNADKETKTNKKS